MDFSLFQFGARRPGAAPGSARKILGDRNNDTLIAGFDSKKVDPMSTIDSERFLKVIDTCTKWEWFCFFCLMAYMITSVIAWHAHYSHSSRLSSLLGHANQRAHKHLPNGSTRHRGKENQVSVSDEVEEGKLRTQTKQS